MLRLTVLGVGDIREPFYRDGMREYEGRLSPYARVSVLSVPDEPLRDGARKREGQRLLDRLDRLSPSVIVALDMRGTSLSSAGLAEFLNQQALGGRSHLCFVIGGTSGLSPDVLRRADFKWSLSDLTFPHQMVPLIVLEQLYRAARILRGEPYHR